jgi:uncharacterized protein YcbK (DUF882 family)
VLNLTFSELETALNQALESDFLDQVRQYKKIACLRNRVSGWVYAFAIRLTSLENFDIILVLRRKMDSPTVKSPKPEKRLVRREFLILGAMTTAAALDPSTAIAAVNRLLKPRKRLSFYNLHTNEYLSICYCRHGEYDPEALKKIYYILRDHRTGDIKAIDSKLLDLLHTICLKTKSRSPVHVISGYRSRTTNSMLRQKTNGIASKSMHIYGKAIDFRIPGFSTRSLRDIAIQVQGGGVGYYPKPDFVHVDVGRVRFW